MEKLMDIKETADLLNVSIPSLYRWVHNGEIPYVKVGGRVLFDPEDIKKWVDGKKIKTKK